MNDFYANSLSLINLEPKNYIIINGKRNEDANMKFILGPGTGLGVIFFNFLYFL